MAKMSLMEKRFTLNEPSPKINNSHKRKSVRVSPGKFPARVQREKINRLLLLHDLFTIPKNNATEKDAGLLKQIALEGTLSNNIPALRYNAIIKLASFPTIDSLDTLSYLATRGEDFYIRGHALLALGATRVEFSIPIIAQYVNDKNSFISNAARKGFIKLINELGFERVQGYYKLNPHLDRAIFLKIIKLSGHKRDGKKSVTKAGTKINLEKLNAK